MARRRGILLAGAAVVAVGVGVVAAVSGGEKQVDGFDAAKWQSARGADPEKNPRPGLLKSLDQAVQPGMPRGEVERLLGPADRQQPDKLVYALGISFPSVDYQYYVFEFDTAGKLTRHYLTRN